MRRLASIILIICLSLVLMIISIEQNSYNKKYYKDFFKKQNIERVSHRSTDELSNIVDNIILYLKAKGGDGLLTPYFNEREILHMQDVQGLFKLARYIKYIGFLVSIYISIYLIKKKDSIFLSKILSYGLSANYIVLSILVFLIHSNFNKYFTYFHLIFFRNTLWILDPNTDLMIQMLPEEFFIGMAKNIVLSFFIYLSIIQILAYLYIKTS
ncbi:MAG: TIGR01906 family membrane protein [Tissierellaceae bacterium]